MEQQKKLLMMKQQSSQSSQPIQAIQALQVVQTVKTVQAQQQQPPPTDYENMSFEMFEQYVNKWFEYDNYVKKASAIVREKKKIKDKLSELIKGYMIKYNIEDFGTEKGRVRCKTSQVKPPVNQKIIKQKIADLLGDRKEVISKIYEQREPVERVSLRQLKITNA